MKAPSNPRSGSPFTEHPHLLAGVFLFLLALLVYLPSLGGEFIWDDYSILVPGLSPTLGNLWRIWFHPTAVLPSEEHYWPLLYTVFWLQRALWGTDPAGYRLVGILIHAGNCVLLWRLLLRLGRPPVAWIAAALFAVHPVHVESVAWIIELKDVLSGLLCLGCAIVWLDATNQSEIRWRSVGAAAVLLAAAMLSKSVSTTVPITLLLLQWLRHGRLTRRDGAALLPLVVVVVVCLVADLSMVRREEVARLGLNLGTRLQIAGVAVWKYAIALVWPVDLVFFYPKWRVAAGGWVGYLPLLVAAALPLLLLLISRRTGRAPAVATAVYGVTLAPMLGIVPHSFMQYAWIADRYQYLASAAPLALLASGLAWWWKPGGGSSARRTALFVTSILAGGWAALTVQGCLRFQDTGTLMRHAAARNPDAAEAARLLGIWEASRGNLGEARQWLERAAERAPGDAGIRYNLAVVHARAGRVADAEREARRAMELRPDYESPGILLLQIGATGTTRSREQITSATASSASR